MLMTALQPHHDKISIVLLIIIVLGSRLRSKVAWSTFSESKSNKHLKPWKSHNTNTSRTSSHVLEWHPVDQSRPTGTQKPAWLRPVTPTQCLRRTYTNAWLYPSCISLLVRVPISPYLSKRNKIREANFTEWSMRLLTISRRRTGIIHIGASTIVFCMLVAVGDCCLLVLRRTQVLIWRYRTLLSSSSGPVLYVLVIGSSVTKSMRVC